MEEYRTETFKLLKNTDLVESSIDYKIRYAWYKCRNSITR